MKNFIPQLTAIETAFLNDIAERGFQITGEYGIAIGNRILIQRAECSDHDDDTVIVRQEIEIWEGELNPLGIIYSWA